MEIDSLKFRRSFGHMAYTPLVDSFFDHDGTHNARSVDPAGLPTVDHDSDHADHIEIRCDVRYFGNYSRDSVGHTDFVDIPVDLFQDFRIEYFDSSTGLYRVLDHVIDRLSAYASTRTADHQ